MERYAIILAAGKGSRMKSLNDEVSKVSFLILDKPLVRYVLDAIEPIGITQKVVVVGFGGVKTSEIVKDRADIVWQRELLGTGHAVMQTKPVLEGKKGSTFILCGDTPLLTTETLNKMLKKHERTNAALTILTACIENPKGYGRIIRDSKTSRVLAIKEDRDCNEHEKYINEINSGVYVVNNELLYKYLDKITPNNNQNEYYLTDLVKLFVEDNLLVESFIIEDSVEIYGVNDRTQLAYASKVIKNKVNKKLMLEGVSLEDPKTTYISPDVEIGPDTHILPNTMILGHSKIGHSNIIGPNSYLSRVEVGNNTQIISSRLEYCKVEDNEVVGPFAYKKGK